MQSNQSKACAAGTTYRTVIGNIIRFAENEVKELYPTKSYVDRLKIAQQEPFWTAAKELRSLTYEERIGIGLGKT